MGGRANITVILSVLLAGCQVIAHADRDLIPSDAGQDGAASTASARSGDLECVLPIDCPPSDGVCVAATCVSGRCGAAPIAEGTPTANQIAGDCKRAVCDGKGVEVLVEDDADVPVDSDPCTDDVCTGGVPSNPKSGAGTPCAVGAGKVCDGHGACVECVAGADCAAGLVCTDNACVP